jgi:RimJ/RimL family protein N-acetyltransferase
MQIRQLTTNDARIYQQLRLKALQTNPESYLAVYETQQDRPTDHFSWEIRYATSPPISGYYGIFLDNQLIGYAQLNQPNLTKQAHIAYIYNLYVDSDHRGQGYASRLIEYLTNLAKEKTNAERVFVTCNRKNAAAQKLYKKLGFKEFATREKSVKWQDEYDDEVELVKEL